ncbi:hypothetical protein G4G27_14180 [Sphingomonas sp. So64.6b]|uniref:hypothetical protein n=1 Tax=Sphingomonas sp. So64.6b TaxID=2997354 RepID=UPI00160205B2|nr:hypothetical protein [Sphingomonas sp. So64.6b]QNA85013.1 hypothetical protein G4G27_14180 [Sphingomonas sp. So64.6b]
MKKIAILIASLGFAATALPVAATAAPYPQAHGQGQWQNINQRQANLYNRIDQGIRSGALNRVEASRLKAQFRQLTNLEAQYRRSRPGLTIAERRDLDRRFDALSQRIKIQKHDRQGRRY